MTSDLLLDVEDLKVWFPVREGVLRKHTNDVRAVDGVSLKIRRGETFGLVGESGCGKSTTGLALLGLEKATGGSVRFDGTDVLGASKSELRALRRRMAMIFQDPYASLNPRRTIGDSIAEPLEIHGLHGNRSERAARVAELLEMVGLSADYRQRYPHEFSGGQRQRVGIARALATEPDFIVCDEPIASLDVSIQAQILNLLRKLQQDLGLTLLFIAHDLSAVQHIADRIGVMYLGRVVEVAEAVAVGENPQHPYTRALLSAVPIPDPKRERARKRILLEGELPSPLNPPSGCNFRTRCPARFEPCPDIDPTLQEADGHLVACHLHGVVGVPEDARVAEQR